MKKRLFNTILVLCMMFSLMPGAIFAAEDSTNNNETKEKNTSTSMLTAEEAGVFLVEGGTLNNEYTYSNDTLIFVKDGNYTVSMKEPGTISTMDRIAVATVVTASITLNGVNIDVSAAHECAFEIRGTANVKMILAANSENSLTSGSQKAGLMVQKNGENLPTLTIEGTGSLTTQGGEGAAGIGGGRKRVCGFITINSGNIIAKGNGAGIGGGTHSSGTDCPLISITGGTIFASSNGASAAIGSGNFGGGAKINLTGGTITALSLRDGAGIGTGQYSGGQLKVDIGGDCVILEAIGGSVKGSGSGIGIGYSSNNSPNEININGNSKIYKAKGGGRFPGIGDGSTVTIGGNSRIYMAEGGLALASDGISAAKFTTEADSNAVLFTTSINDKSLQSSWNGIIFEKDTGSVYGNVILNDDLTIPSSKELVFNSDATLTVAAKKSLTNQGTIDVKNETFTNNGTIKNYGSILNWTPNGNILDKSQTKVTFAVKQPNGNYIDATTAAYDDTVRITATMTKPQIKARSAAVDKTVNFYLGGVSDTKLNENPISVSNNNGILTATIDVELNGDNWKPNDDPYTITADFGGYSTENLLDSIGNGELVISKKKGKVAPTTKFSFDGINANKIMDTTSMMEYSLNGGTNWIDCTDTSTDLSTKLANIKMDNGIQIRLKETDIQLTGEIQTINITQGVKPNLVPTQANIIGGKGSVPMTTLHEYNTDNGNTWTSANGLTTLEAGTYYVRLKATGTVLPSQAQEITLREYIGTPEIKPEATFNAKSENGGILANITTQMKYSINGGISWLSIADTSMEITGVTPTYGIKIKRLGNGRTTTDSEVQTIDITVGSEVTGVTAIACTNINGNDGKLQGVTAAMEYRANNSSNWITGDGKTITGLLSGSSYLVRMKANGTMLASAESSFTIAAHTHTPSTTWSKDNTHHWHECTADDGEKMNKASHTFAEWVIDKKATETSKGSKHRDCTVCGQRETVEIPAIIAPAELIVTDGANASYQIGSGKDMILTCSGKLEDLIGIYVDGKLVDASNYTLKSGSTILTLKASYLNTLSARTHVVKFQYKDNLSAETNFTMTAKGTAETGDATDIAFYPILLLLSGCIVGIIVTRRKKFNK